MIEKAPHGSPCNSCGMCCRAEPCPLGAFVFGRWEGPCPALEAIDNGGGVCGMVAHPEVYRMARTLSAGRDVMIEAAKHLIGAGRGCDGQQEGEPYNEEFGRQMRSQREPSKTRRALRVWGLDALARQVR